MAKNLTSEDLEQKAKLIELHEDEGIILEAAQMAQEVLQRERYITISNARAIPTIVYEGIKCLMATIARKKSTDKDLVVNYAHLFDAGVSYQESDDGEKDGNFVPIFADGQIMRTLMKDDGTTEVDE